MVALDLALAGVAVDAWIAFEPAPGAKPQEDAAALNLRWQTAKDQAVSGARDPDEVMKEQGYDGWFDKSRLPSSQAAAMSPFGFTGAIFRFDKSRGRYRFIRPSLGHVSTPPKPARRGRQRNAAGPGAAALQRMVTRFLNRYAGKVAPVLGRLQFDVLEDLKAAVAAAPENTWKDADEFGRWALNEMQTSFGKRWSEYGGAEFETRVLEQHEAMAKAWREDMRKRWSEKDLPAELGESTTDAVKALAATDTHHMSVYLESLSGAERKTMENVIAEQFLNAGQDVYNPDVMDDLLNRMERSGSLLLRRRDHGREGGEASETDEQARERMAERVARIVETTVMRSRNTAEIYGLEDAAYETFVVVRDPGSEAIPGEICTEMDGRTFSVEVAAKAMRDFHAMTAEEQEAELTRQREATADDRESLPAGQVPPYHPWCRCTLEGQD
jgi:hypothetical protein